MTLKNTHRNDPLNNWWLSSLNNHALLLDCILTSLAISIHDQKMLLKSNAHFPIAHLNVLVWRLIVWFDATVIAPFNIRIKWPLRNVILKCIFRFLYFYHNKIWLKVENMVLKTVFFFFLSCLRLALNKRIDRSGSNVTVFRYAFRSNFSVRQSFASIQTNVYFLFVIRKGSRYVRYDIFNFGDISTWLLHHSSLYTMWHVE